MKKKPCGDCENYRETDNGLSFCSNCKTQLPSKVLWMPYQQAKDVQEFMKNWYKNHVQNPK